MFQRFTDAVRRFMSGRNGVDTLAWFWCILSILLNLVSGLTELSVLALLSNVAMVLALFRVFSRNTTQRYEENLRFTQFFARIKGRKTHCYYRCPGCKTKVRVPRGKGKIKITCPSCRESFIKKT